MTHLAELVFIFTNLTDSIFTVEMHGCQGRTKSPWWWCDELAVLQDKKRQQVKAAKKKGEEKLITKTPHVSPAQDSYSKHPYLDQWWWLNCWIMYFCLPAFTSSVWAECIPNCGWQEAETVRNCELYPVYRWRSEIAAGVSSWMGPHVWLCFVVQKLS